MRIDRRSFVKLSAAGIGLTLASNSIKAQNNSGDSGDEEAPGEQEAESTDHGISEEEVDGEVHEVEMLGSNSFDPIGLHVQPGDAVKWTAVEGVHNAQNYPDRIPDGAEEFQGPILDPGETFTHEFTEEGTYDYFCSPHKALGMVGRIVVGEPGGPAAMSEIPDKPPDGAFPSEQDIVNQGVINYPFVESDSSMSTPQMIFGLVGLLGSALLGGHGVMRYRKDESSAELVFWVVLAAGLLLLFGMTANLVF